LPGQQPLTTRVRIDLEDLKLVGVSVPKKRGADGEYLQEYRITEKSLSEWEWYTGDDITDAASTTWIFPKQKKRHEHWLATLLPSVKKTKQEGMGTKRKDSSTAEDTDGNRKRDPSKRSLSLINSFIGLERYTDNTKSNPMTNDASDNLGEADGGYRRETTLTKEERKCARQGKQYFS